MHRAAALFLLSVFTLSAQSITRVSKWGSTSGARTEAALSKATDPSRGVGMRIDEVSIPVGDAVQGACEILGLDPLYVANEGRFAVFVPEAQAARVVEILKSLPVSSQAVRIGEVTEGPRNVVTMSSRIGGSRIVDMLSGEQLPRIC